MVKQTRIPTKRFVTTPTQAIQTTGMTENLDLSTDPVRHVVKTTIPRRNATLEQTQLIDHLSGTDGRKERIRSNKEMLKAFQM